MTDAELDRIESMLGITLPTSYRAAMLAYPIRAYFGNSDTSLWDDAEKLIELNQELCGGKSAVRAWPAHLYCIGLDGDGSANVLDLRDPSAPVWSAYKSHMDSPDSYQSHETFEACSMNSFAIRSKTLKSRACRRIFLPMSFKHITISSFAKALHVWFGSSRSGCRSSSQSGD